MQNESSTGERDDTALDADFALFQRRGDAAALARVFDRAAPRLLLLAAHFARDAAEAEDLVQTTFLHAVRDAASWESGRPVAAWLAGILRHRALDLLRARRRRPESELDGAPLAANTAGPAALAEQHDLFERVVAATQRIEEPFRTVLLMRLVHGLEPASIAHTLGRAPGTVRMQLKRGLEKLRERLPASLGGALGATLAALTIEGRGLANVRDAVLTEAASGAAATTVGGAASLSTSLTPTLALFAHAKHWLVAAAVVLATAVVWLTRDEPDPLFEATAPASATELASAANPPANEVALELAPPAASVDARAPLAARPQEPAPDLARIRGVLLRHDGEPAVDARLVLKGWPSNSGNVKRYGMPTTPWEDVVATPNADGSFELAFDPPRAFQFVLDVTAPWAVTLDRRYSDRRPGSVTDLGTITMPIGGRIEGRVITPSGEPAPGAWGVSAKDFFPVPWRSSGERTTHVGVDRESGVFVLEGLAPGRVALELNSSQVPSRTAHTEVRAGETTAFDFVYDGPPADRRIAIGFSGPLSNTFGGPAPANFELRSLEGPAVLPGTLTERVNGLAVFPDVAPGEHVLVVTDPRFAPFESEPVRGSGGTLARLTGSVELTLVVTREGEPVENARFDFQGRATLGRPSSTFEFDAPFVRKDAPGTYVFDTVPDAQYWHVVSPGSEARRVDFGAGFEPGSQPVATVELTRMRTIAGRVVDFTGQPLADSRVVAVPVGQAPPSREDFEAWNAWQQGVQSSALYDNFTNAEGAFEIGPLTEAAYDIYTDHDMRVRAIALDVPLDASQVELRLQPTGRIEGRLDPVFDGCEKTKVHIGWNLGRDRMPERLAPLAVHMPTFAVGDDGRFVIEHAPLGSCNLHVLLPGGSVRSAHSTTTSSNMTLEPIPVDVVWGSSAEIVVDVTSALPIVARIRVNDVRSSGIHLQVVGTRHAAVPNLFGSDAAGSVMDGVAEITPVTPGRWSFEVRSLESPWVCPIPGEHDIAPNETFELSFDIELVAGRVTVVDANGEAQPGAVLRFLRTDGWSSVTADAKGELELVLPPGTHMLQPMGAPEPDPVSGTAERITELVWTSTGPAEPVLVLRPVE